MQGVRRSLKPGRLRWVAGRCQAALGRVRRYWWRAQFLVQGWASNAEIEIAAGVEFMRPTLFQGEGSVHIGPDVRFGDRMANAPTLPIQVQPRSREARIVIGEGTRIMNGVEILAVQSITFGQCCLIGARAVFMDCDFHGLAPDARHAEGVSRPIVLEDNVWVGGDAMILKGVTVGGDAVIGAGAVVTKPVPPGAIVVGSPARVIGSVYDR